MQTPPHTLDDWLAHCERLHPKNIELGLDRVRAVAQRMGLRLDCPVITVAGTNGKGSTCAMLEAICLQAGWRTGVYTSPHLVHFEERCRIHGEIAGRRAGAAFRGGGGRARRCALTYFEFTTLAILAAWRAALDDVAILEVGLGGRLDAVNIIDADCAIITSVDLDHMEFLGTDREQHRPEKAGILRTGRPAIVSDPMPPQSVIDRATAIGADLWRLGHDFNFSGRQAAMGWAGRGRRYAGLAYPALRGANQLINAVGRAGRAGGLARAPAGDGAGGAQWPGHGRAAGALPDRAGPAHAGAGRGAQPAFGGGAGANLDAMGFYPTHPCRVRRHGRQGPGPHAGASMGPWSTAGTSPTCPRRAPPRRRLLAQWQAQEKRGRAGQHLGPPPRRCARRSPRQTPLIESSSSDRSTPWAACCRTGIPRLQATHLAA
jgi:dihydrofolate synthase/folylpolyglutamate synthase